MQSILNNQEISITQTNDTISEKYDQIVKSLNQLKTQIINLQMVRDQAIICFQQYSLEINDQVSLLTKLRTLVEPIPSLNEHPPPFLQSTSFINSQTTQKLSLPNLNSNQFSFPQVNNNFPILSNSDSTIQPVQFSYHIQSQSAFFNASSVHLRFSHSTNALLASVRFDPTGNFFTYADSRTVYILNSKEGLEYASMSIPRVPGAS